MLAERRWSQRILHNSIYVKCPEYAYRKTEFSDCLWLMREKNQIKMVKGTRLCYIVMKMFKSDCRDICTDNAANILKDTELYI